MKKRSILLVIIFFISIIILSVNSNNKYLVKEESLATYIDGEKTDSFPVKGTVAFSKAECDNNTNIYWDNDTWGLYVTNLNEKTKCNLYFKTLENAVTKITNLASTDTVNMATDDPDNNIRYIGANPNNYVYFNCDDYNNQTSDTCELWRIIGVFNNVEKEDGTKENLIKIIREDNLGYYSWDYKSDGSHVNDWNTSSLQQLLNNGAYYEATTGIYYKPNSESINIDFKKDGLQNEATRSAIENIVWQLGKIENYNTSTAGIYYNLERNINGGNQNYMTWNGKIALMYSSDYGFATSGGKIKSRSDCLNKELYNWGNSEYTECFQNDFLHISTSSQWSINAYALNDVFAYAIDGDGCVGRDGVQTLHSVRPSLFLKSNISIGIGDGSSTNPYQLSL